MIYSKKKSLLFANFKAMQRFYGIEFFSKNFLALYLNLIILILIIFSLAGIGISIGTTTSSFSYVIAIDNSQSMSAADILPNRLSAAKEEAKKFVDLLPLGVDIGVISFSGDAKVYKELDNSKLKTKLAIDAIDFGEIPGTNLYNALLTANNIFSSRQMKSVILISDGQFNVGEAPEVIRYLNRNNLIVHTIAVGTFEGGLVEELNIISKVDEDFLKSIAFNSGGLFFRARNTEELKDSLESIILKTDRKVTIDLSSYFLIAAVILFTISWVLYSLRFRIIP
jgi:Ca-activated chloride channel family protein